jgi:ketosteroid isomerase-like protein
MPSLTAAETVAHVITLRQAGKFDEAVAFYAEDVAFVAQPGTVLRGREQARLVLEQMSKAFQRFAIVRRETVEVGDLALHQSSWVGWTSAETDAPSDAQGATADVMRRDADGVWRFIVDNPWGAAILG